MKKLFWIVVLALVGFLMFQGCVRERIQKAEIAYDTKEFAPVSETREEFIPEKIEIISKIPFGTYPKLRIGNRSINVAELQKELLKGRGSLTIFINKEKLLIKILIAGKWGYRWVEPGTIFLAKFYQDPKTGIKEYELLKLGFCKNPVQSVKIRVHPAMATIRTTITQITTERYLDVKTKIDYTLAILSLIIGLLAGLLIGWIFPVPSFGKKTPSS